MTVIGESSPRRWIVVLLGVLAIIFLIDGILEAMMGNRELGYSAIIVAAGLIVVLWGYLSWGRRPLSVPWHRRDLFGQAIVLSLFGAVLIADAGGGLIINRSVSGTLIDLFAITVGCGALVLAIRKLREATQHRRDNQRLEKPRNLRS